MIISQHGQTAVRSLTILDRFDRAAKQTECLTGRRVRRRRLLHCNLGDDRPALCLW